jgi:hypothetical protein
MDDLNVFEHLIASTQLEGNPNPKKLLFLFCISLHQGNAVNAMADLPVPLHVSSLGNYIQSLSVLSQQIPAILLTEAKINNFLNYILYRN